MKINWFQLCNIYLGHNVCCAGRFVRSNSWLRISHAGNIYEHRRELWPWISYSGQGKRQWCGLVMSWRTTIQLIWGWKVYQCPFCVACCTNDKSTNPHWQHFITKTLSVNKIRGKKSLKCFFASSSSEQKHSSNDSSTVLTDALIWGHFERERLPFKRAGKQ